MNNIEFSLMWNEPITSTDGAYHHQLTKATYASAENRRGTIFAGEYLNLQEDRTNGILQAAS